MKGIVLLSGGLDSTTVLAIAKGECKEVQALSFDYGQRHKKELLCTKKIAKFYNVRHRIIKLDLSICRSALIGKNQKITGRKKKVGIPTTYVPARNTIFISFALGYAESINADAIYIGANSIDYSGYPDCRPEYYDAFRKLVKLGTRAGAEGKEIKILTPLINMRKSEIIRKGIELSVPYELTWSCYKGGKKACGTCDACQLRINGFRDAGYEDPIEYEARNDCK
ncbi:MAG: 7-cyano-7-deazaguanine synthase QueC [Candidatus Thermoplasmatota archaeon]